MSDKSVVNDTQRSGAKAPTFDELRKLFDKTVAAFSGSMVDYQERVNHGLFKVYELGRLHGRTDKLSSKTLANRAKTPGVHTMSPDNVIEWSIGVLRGIVERHPETLHDCDVEAFIADQLQPTLDNMRSALSETAQPPASEAGVEKWRAAIDQRPTPCACRFEWREVPDLSGAPPKQLDECGFHAEQRRKFEAELAALRADGGGEKVLVPLHELEELSLMAAFDQADPSIEQLESILDGIGNKVERLLAAAPSVGEKP